MGAPAQPAASGYLHAFEHRWVYGNVVERGVVFHSVAERQALGVEHILSVHILSG